MNTFSLKGSIRITKRTQQLFTFITVRNSVKFHSKKDLHAPSNTNCKTDRQGSKSFLRTSEKCSEVKATIAYVGKTRWKRRFLLTLGFLFASSFKSTFSDLESTAQHYLAEVFFILWIRKLLRMTPCTYLHLFTCMCPVYKNTVAGTKGKQFSLLDIGFTDNEHTMKTAASFLFIYLFILLYSSWESKCNGRSNHWQLFCALPNTVNMTDS